jgi:hypothetical protein
VVLANDIRNAILNLANKNGSRNLFYPAEVAKYVDSDNWESHIEQVQLVADSLMREGQIEILKTGRLVEIAYTKTELQ